MTFKALRDAAAHKMPPEQYREKWHLAPDCPLVTPAYAKARSALDGVGSLAIVWLLVKEGREAWSGDC